MSLGHLYGVPADIGALKEGLPSVGAAGVSSGPTRRHNTKRNAGPKLRLGRADAAYGATGLSSLPASLSGGGGGGGGGGGSVGDGVPSSGSSVVSDADEMSAAASAAAEAERAGVSMPLAAFKAASERILRAFLAEADYDGVLSAVAALRSPAFHGVFVKRALVLALEADDAARELISRLLSLLYGLVLTMRDMAAGFQRLLEALDDLALDVPSAHNLAARFLARAVADEILPPAFLSDAYVASLAGDAVAQARALLSVAHSAERLERVWPGAAGQLGSLPELKARVRAALAEFFAGGDLAEALARVKELGSPHFAHEVAYRAIVLALDEWPRAGRAAAAAALLAAAAADGAVSRSQAALGARRALDELDELRKDAPRARQGLRAIVADAAARGALTSDDAREIIDAIDDDDDGGGRAAAHAGAE
jgi:hypothetical protein